MKPRIQCVLAHWKSGFIAFGHEERYAELAAAVDAHCPVLDLFQNPVPVSRALHLADPAQPR